ncbi:MAG TPA: glycogen/starch synthase, partial [Geobacterales bacterium]|nr:glycogen/starch synthase [Geobacterales bacterium]
MRILVMASEVAPFARTGGLADVSGALPRALKERGHDVRVILPFYRQIEKGPFPLTKLRRSVEINLAGTFYKGQLRQTIHRQLPVYFLENRHFFGREQLYGPAGGDYEDNDQRFAFFCRAVLAMLKRIDFRPDIIHCNDWQTALVPLILASELASDPFFATMAPVLTIHNLAFQGIFEATSLRRMGLNSGLLNPEELEFFGRVNLLKGGIRHARMITTVSPTYRSEILTPEGG